MALQSLFFWHHKCPADNTWRPSPSANRTENQANLPAWLERMDIEAATVDLAPFIAGAGGLAHISQAKDFGFTAHASIFRNAKTLTAMHRTALVLVPVVLGCQVLGVEYRYVIPRWAHDRERRRDEEEVRRHVDVGMCFGAASWLVRLYGLKCGRAFWAPMDVIMFGALSDLMHREYYRAHNL
ncbi:hypothetical protein M433DRAFT_138156 [Acidomyces richmondensis BFW]|nr:MAG: hypothetical protein FE78DRAFT_81166 [Acidomyces sp. 'richmondensis']KYG41280.1 hypothetical protein M433DRAFT_138156 [Acidomyces richmondensis BFW]